MSNQKKQLTYADPMSPERVAPFVNDVTKTGQELVATLSDKINTVSVMRSMQIGYMMACQDHGLPIPDFDDPADTLLNIKV